MTTIPVGGEGSRPSPVNSPGVALEPCGVAAALWDHTKPVATQILKDPFLKGIAAGDLSMYEGSRDRECLVGLGGQPSRDSISLERTRCIRSPACGTRRDVFRRYIKQDTFYLRAYAAACRNVQKLCKPDQAHFAQALEALLTGIDVEIGHHDEVP